MEKEKNMYCTKCGRRIDYDSYVCDECRASEEASKKHAEEEQKSTDSTNSDSCSWNTAQQENLYDVYSEKSRYEPRPQATTAPVNPRMAGFGKALIAVIFIVPEFIFIYLMAFTASLGSISCILFFFVSLSFAIPSVIMGVRSLKFSLAQKNKGQPTPIATMVCGIIAIAESAMILLILLFAFLLFMIALMSVTMIY